MLNLNIINQSELSYHPETNLWTDRCIDGSTYRRTGHYKAPTFQAGGSDKTCNFITCSRVRVLESKL